MRAALTGLLTGMLFGVGLSIAEMTNPEKVLAFLDVLGGWDASLMFTMGGAVAVTLIGFRLVLKRGPLFDEMLHLPTKTAIDARLLSGAAVFGLGWGIAGYCPGPAIAGLTFNPQETIVFLIAMLAGAQLPPLFDSKNVAASSH